MASEVRVHAFVTARCNNNCVFCLDGERKELMDTLGINIEKGPAEVDPFRARIRVLRSRTRRIVFTYGEPTTNPHLPLFVAAAREAGYEDIALVTNGRMLSYPGFCVALLAAGLTRFIVSIHGHTHKLHDAHTRTKGSFGQAARGLENLGRLRRRMPFRLHTASTITRINMNHLKEILLFLQSYGPDRMILNPVIPEGHGRTYAEKLVPRYSDLIATISRAVVPLFENGALTAERVTATDLPLCTVDSSSPLFGWKETIISGECESPTCAESCGNAAVARQRKTRGDPCKSCSGAQVCGGVFEGYVQEFGWGEFHPIQPSGSAGAER